MAKYYFCIDVGGTEIKGGIVDENYQILHQDKMKTKEYEKTGSITKTITTFINQLEAGSNFSVKNSSGIGIGFPGLVDNKKGTIEYINCLKIKNVTIVDELQNLYGLPVKIANDAELATLAELNIGNGKNYKNFVMLTIGTGIGSGVVLNGQTLRSFLPFSCEFGHTKISENPSESFELLASTKALVAQTKQAMKENPNSKMWNTYNIESANGKTIFDYKDTDHAAKKVFENYIKNLGNGIINFCNTFAPDIVIIGGGISGQGEVLTAPLEEYVNNNIFVKNIEKRVKIITAKFMNNAGILGARCLFK